MALAGLHAGAAGVRRPRLVPGVAGPATRKPFPEGWFIGLARRDVDDPGPAGGIVDRAQEVQELPALALADLRLAGAGHGGARRDPPGAGPQLRQRAGLPVAQFLRRADGVRTRESKTRSRTTSCSSTGASHTACSSLTRSRPPGRSAITDRTAASAGRRRAAGRPPAHRRGRAWAPARWRLWPRGRLPAVL